jgi:hypothetical protein
MKAPVVEERVVAVAKAEAVLVAVAKAEAVLVAVAKAEAVLRAGPGHLVNRAGEAR